MMLLIGIGTLFLIIVIIAMTVIITEAVKLIRNPVPRTQNHDKRFSEVKNEYIQKMYQVESR